jgi:hypothetical protein
MVHACNPSTWEIKAGRSQVPGQPELHSKIWATQQDQVFKKKKKKKLGNSKPWVQTLVLQQQTQIYTHKILSTESGCILKLQYIMT